MLPAAKSFLEEGCVVGEGGVMEEERRLGNGV